MTPERKEDINGQQIREYYWNGEYVVYINNKLSDLTFEEAVEEAKQE